MAAQTSMLHIRVDEEIKAQATAALTTTDLSDRCGTYSKLFGN